MALSAKHRKFVDRVIVGDSATAAYCAAYGCKESVGGANGHRLLKKAEIAEAIAGRLQKASAKADLTLESHLASLNALREQAAAANQFGPAVSAEVNRGKASGLYVEKTQVTGELTVRVVRD